MPSGCYNRRILTRLAISSGFNRVGFSLLEVMFAALIFASVIGGIAVTWRFHERSVQKYRNRNAAQLILSQEMERITAHPYTNLEDARRTVTIPLVRSINGVETAVPFQVSSDIYEHPSRRLKDITVSVTFTEQNQTLTLSAVSRKFISQ